MSRILTTNKFVRRSRKIHGDRYNYDSVHYDGYETTVKIYCNTCNSDFFQKPHNHFDGCGCPYCSNKQISSFNCFATHSPSLVKEWHAKNKFTPFSVSPKSERSVWWICSQGHIYDMRISYRVKGCGCPYCSGHRVNKDNCLGIRNPALVKKWHPTKNGNITPFDVTSHSGKKIWWKCEKGHEYQGSVDTTVRYNIICPYCSGRYATPENCLAIKYPKIAKDWDYVRNKKGPLDFTPSSGAKVFWICSECHESYLARIYNRTYSGSSCPVCLYKNQREVGLLLKKHLPSFKFEFNKTIKTHPNGSIKRRCDFWLENKDINIMVEYDGIQHFEPVAIFGGEKRFREQQKKDKSDDYYCKKNNVLLFRIKYNEDKLERVKELVRIVSLQVHENKSKQSVEKEKGVLCLVKD